MTLLLTKEFDSKLNPARFTRVFDFTLPFSSIILDPVSGSGRNQAQLIRKGSMEITLKLHKRHEKGAATYINPATRARVIVSRKMFAGEPPETVEIGVANLREATEADLAKAQKAATREANRVEKAANLH